MRRKEQTTNRNNRIKTLGSKIKNSLEDLTSQKIAAEHKMSDLEDITSAYSRRLGKEP